MIGHRQVIEARQQGLRPRTVELVIGPAPVVRYPWQDPETLLADGAMPSVYTDGDSPELADLRFLVGLRVSILPRECSTDLWMRWWFAVQAARPLLLASIDPETEETLTWPQ